jgi:Arc/MetJ-type ribon-helix-helix transcriptional regulator
MPSKKPATTIRFSDQDREILQLLQDVTGLDSASSVIRLAIREALASRAAQLPKVTKKGRK